MAFDKARYRTRGIEVEVSQLMQAYLWKCIEDLKIEKDYLQVFRCSASNGVEKIIHEQEVPQYKKTHRILLNDNIKPFTGKIFVIDDGDYSTMLLAEEY